MKLSVVLEDNDGLTRVVLTCNDSPFHSYNFPFIASRTHLLSFVCF